MKKIGIYFIILLNFILVPESLAFISISAGGFQGYQVVIQKESLYKTKTTLASLPTIGVQLQVQQTFADRFAIRFKAESILVKFQTPSLATLSSETFRTNNYATELAFQRDVNLQYFIRVGHKERILFNLDDTLAFHLYKSTSTDYGLGLNFDTQNLGGFVFGVGTTISLLNFNSKDINENFDSSYGYEGDIRAKIGWIYESTGLILRSNYLQFYLPCKIDKNTGREIRFFAEIVHSW